MKISDDRKKKEIIQRISAILRFYDPNCQRYYLDNKVAEIDGICSVDVLSAIVSSVLWTIRFDIEGRLGRVHNMPTDDELSQRIDSLFNQENGVK